MSGHFLDSQHKVYTQWEEEWRRNERRSAGGLQVLDELYPFQYESPDGPQHKARKNQASYLNFPDQASRGLTGHLVRSAPSSDSGISFGTLGTVARDEGQALPSRAELLWYNADGVGRDGSQWSTWWTDVTRRAMHTGHRWIMVEAPPEAPRSFQEVLDGRRPWLAEFSPLAVPNWHYSHGRLDFAIVRFPHRQLSVTDGILKDNAGQGYLLMVREGFGDLGADFQAGGWWKYTPGKEIIGSGDWRATRGEIPFFPHFYERWSGTRDFPAISKPGTTEIGQVAVSYMNLASSARFDAWSAGASMTMLLGVTPDQYQVAATKMREGSILIPVPPHPETGAIPQVYDASQGAVTSGVFGGLLDGLKAEAAELTMAQATSAPDSSGEAKRVGFEELKAPRLADLAQQLEQSQNTALHFLELRFGTVGPGRDPTGSVTWPREFDLRDVVDDIRRHFELERLSGYRSRTVASKGMARAARDHRIVESDQDLNDLREEYAEAWDRQDMEADRARRLGAELGLPGL
jgi:hypothetical protein